MNQHKGYYSLIQFCPDPSRLEGINIGVLVFPRQPQTGISTDPKQSKDTKGLRPARLELHR